MTEKYIIAKDEIAALLMGETFTLQPPLHNGVAAFQVEINEAPLTNGDVIKALFNCHVQQDSIVTMATLDRHTEFSTKWWNAPYKRE